MSCDRAPSRGTRVHGQLRHDHEGDRRDGSAPSTRRRFSGVSIGQSVAVGEALPRRIAGNWITEPRQLTDNVHSTRSSHREALLEHLFAGEVMKHLWRRGDWRLEVLKPHVDDGGSDLVLA